MYKHLFILYTLITCTSCGFHNGSYTPKTKNTKGKVQSLRSHSCIYIQPTITIPGTGTHT